MNVPAGGKVTLFYAGKEDKRMKNYLPHFWGDSILPRTTRPGCIGGPENRTIPSLDQDA